MKSLCQFVACAATLSSLAAWAQPGRAAFIIDTFNDTVQTTHATGRSTISANNSPAPEALGGIRSLIANTDAGGDNFTRFTANIDMPGEAALVNGPSNNGTGTAAWGITAFGGLNLDLTQGGASTKFAVKISPGAEYLDIIVEESPLERASAMRVNAPSGIVMLPFANFVPNGKPAANFQAADYITLIVGGGPGASVGIDWVQVVPEPAGLTLVMLGAAGTWLVRRRGR